MSSRVARYGKIMLMGILSGLLLGVSQHVIGRTCDPGDVRDWLNAYSGLMVGTLVTGAGLTMWLRKDDR